MVDFTLVLMYINPMVKTDNQSAPGLGTLLRYLTERIDRGSETRYRETGVTTRARYTPILRALHGAPLTVTELEARSLTTQGAISQTVKLMEKEGLLRKVPMKDGRARALVLTNMGRALHDELGRHWSARLAAIDGLEKEIDAPLRKILSDALAALDRTDFRQRIEDAEG